jgi:transposase-like protein
MSKNRYSAEFKKEAARLIIIGGMSVAETSKKLGSARLSFTNGETPTLRASWVKLPHRARQAPRKWPPRWTACASGCVRRSGLMRF